MSKRFRNRRVELTGQRFGQLVVIRFAPEVSKPNYDKWLCRCDCGMEKAIGQGHLLSGASTSCGHTTRTQGGLAAKHPMYWRWSSMKERCESPECPNFHNYGGRGIKVCERWQNFPTFLADMESSYFDGASIERINNDGDYEPSNCRWATAREQLANQRRTVFVETPWGKMTRADAARKSGFPVKKFITRHHRGWSIERLLDPSNWTRDLRKVRTSV